MKKTITLLLIVVMLIGVTAGCSQDKSSSTPEATTTEESQNNETTTEKEENSADSVAGEALKKAIDDADTIIIDARKSAAYNGWTLETESRGGHIENAILFSSSWVSLAETDEALTNELKKFNILKDKDIIVYGYGEDAKILHEKLLALGYSSQVSQMTFQEIAEDTSIPLEKMENHEALVHPKWVSDVLNGDSDINNYLIAECSWGDGSKIENYIPESIHIHTGEYEEDPLWNRVSDEEILNSMLANGITADTTVILYSSVDTTPAARIANILKYAGVTDVRVLDGGIQAWKAEGFDTIAEAVEATPVEKFGTEVPANPEYIVDLEEAEKILSSDNGSLISIRSWVEYIGETSGYDYIEAAGRIKGAKYGYAGSDPWHMEDYRNLDNTMISYEYMKDRWSTMDIDSSDQNAFYCGTGWRASETWFYAYAMGWDNISVYDGGWKEWSEAEKTTAKGIPASGVPAGK